MRRPCRMACGPLTLKSVRGSWGRGPVRGYGRSPGTRGTGSPAMAPSAGLGRVPTRHTAQHSRARRRPQAAALFRTGSCGASSCSRECSRGDRVTDRERGVGTPAKAHRAQAREPCGGQARQSVTFSKEGRGAGCARPPPSRAGSAPSTCPSPDSVLVGGRALTYQ